MYSIKNIVTAASFALVALGGVSAASAAPSHNPVGHNAGHNDRWDHRPAVTRHDPYFNRMHRPIVVRERIFDTLRFHHYRGVGSPLFVRGHYVVKSFDRFGHTVFVEVDPYTGAFLGEFRV